MPEDYGDFETFLNEKTKARGLTLEKIAELTGISMSHLESLSRGHYENLPPAPYIHGYLVKLAAILDFDPEIWWTRFRHMNVMRSSGAADRLPENRFALVSRNKYAIVGILAVLLLVYAGFRLPQTIGKPILSIDYPPNEITTVAQGRVTIQGYLRNGSELNVNSEPVQIREDGFFEYELPLSPGLNTALIVGKKFLGGETQAVRQIFYEIPPEANTPGGRTILPPAAESTSTDI